jgi:large subunit ribosomal protein L30
MSKVKVTQVKSAIDRPMRQKRTLKALKLGRIGKYAEFESNPAVEGMIAKVNHLIKVERN